MRNSFQIIIIVLFCIACCTLWQESLAVEYQYRNYTILDGLAQSRVRAIAQDAHGYLWFGTTWGGLSRFDGKAFQNFTTVEGLADNAVQTMFKDSKGRFWVGGEQGVSLYQKGGFVPFMPKDFPKVAVYSIIEDRGGLIWFGTDNGAYCFDNKKLIRFTAEKHGILPGPVYSIFKDQKGDLWLGTTKGISQYNSLAFKNYTDIPIAITCVTQDTSGLLWFGTESGLWQYDHANWKEIKPFGDQADNRINALLTDKNGAVWVGTNEGLVKFEGSQWQTYTQANGLPDNAILSLFEDSQGNKWLGTTLAGVSRMIESPFKLFHFSNNPLKNLVWSISEDKNGRLWFGSEDGLVTYQDGKLQPLTGGLIGKQIICILEDKSGAIWFGTESGLSRYNGNSFDNFSTPDRLYGELVRCMMQDRKGNLWFGTRKGVARYDGQTFQKLKAGGQPLQARVLGILEDKKGRLWFATRDHGAILYDDNKIVYYDTTNGLPSNEVSNIIEDKKGNLWLTTWGGLVRYDGNNFKTYSTKEGLASRHIWLIQEDAQGFFWLGHEKGVERFDPQTGNSLHYGYLEGFTPIETNERAVGKDAKGNIWFGTVSGVVRYDPTADVSNPFPPITHITNVLLNRRKIDWEQFGASVDSYFRTPIEPVLDHNQNNLVIEFIGIHYTIPEKIVYQWKLEGYEEDWTPITSVNFAAYTNLPPGTYTFLLRARNGRGIWTQEPTRFQFSIRPPFWLRWWFVPIYPLMIIGGLIGFARLRERNYKQAKLKLESMIAERTVELRKEKETVEHQNELLEESRRHITDSLEYARRLQLAILPARDNIMQAFPDSFILYRPKDIVSGDFYWFTVEEGYYFIAAVDCTGHGVPGAFMSVLGNSLLNQLITQDHILSPAEVLNKMHERVVRTLKQFDAGSGTQDGMEVILCRIQPDNAEIVFAGANRPLYYFHNHQLETIKGDKMPIGGGIFRQETCFTEHKRILAPNDSIYLFSDGYADQFGGPDGKRKYTTGKLIQFLAKIQNAPMQLQEQLLLDEFDKWSGTRKQLDDVMAIGLRFRAEKKLRF